MLFRKLQFTDGLTNLKRGYVGFENKHSPGRPVEATAQEKIHELLKTDRKSTDGQGKTQYVSHPYRGGGGGGTYINLK